MKTPMESLICRLSEVEDKISGLKDKVDDLEYSYNNKENVIIQHTRPLGHH
jgi:hypothetical protein